MTPRLSAGSQPPEHRRDREQGDTFDRGHAQALVEGRGDHHHQAVSRVRPDREIDEQCVSLGARGGTPEHDRPHDVNGGHHGFIRRIVGLESQQRRQRTAWCEHRRVEENQCDPGDERRQESDGEDLEVDTQPAQPRELIHLPGPLDAFSCS